MIIKIKSDTCNNSIKSSKNNQDIVYESKNRKKIIFKKVKLNLEGNLPIKVHLANRNPKNEKQNDLNTSNNNISLMSSFYLKTSFQNSTENKSNKSNKSNTSSSFHKKNIKMINVLNNNDNEFSNKQPFEKDNYNEDKGKNSIEKKGGISKLKELLSATKEINNNYNSIFKTENIPIRNIKKFETKNNDNKNVINDNNNGNIKNNIRNILTIGYNKNIDKEKIYDLICEKRNSKNLSKRKDIYNKTETKENINNINDINNENIYKNWQNSNYKIKNILAKNFIISDDNKSNNIRKNKSPNKLTYNNHSIINKKIKEIGNENDITSLQSNNSKDTLKITNSSNTKTTTSNITEKVKNLKNLNSELNNYFYLNNKSYKQNMKLKSSFQYNDEITNVKNIIFNSPQKWDDNSDNGLENNNNYNPNANINFNRNKKRIDINNKIDSNKSVELKYKLNKFKYLNDYENKNQKIDKKDKISIKFDELIIFVEIINDISISLSSNNTLKEEYLNNKSSEFFEFYLNSSLYNKFSGFFSEENFIIIQSSINLFLFIIMFIYYLFNNLEISNQYISILNNIFNKLKVNLYLIVRQIELYYNNSSFFELNENKTHFNKIINKFKNSNIYNIKDLNEEDIILEINDNCTNISNNIHKLLNKYFDYLKNNNNNEKNYYNEFLNIFNQISLMTEGDIANFFYNHINKKNDNKNNEDKSRSKMSNIFLNYKNFNSSMKNRRTIKQNKTDINYSNYKNINSFTKDINSNTDLNEFDFDSEERNIKNKYISIYRINEQNKNNNKFNVSKSIDDNYFQNSNLIPPFIRNEKPKNKKYTLILDLDETLVHVERINQQINNNSNYNSNDQKVINLRPGLFSFLNSVKPYYEIISFSTASKNYADNIVKKIETNQKYFDYNLYRDHTTLYGKEYIKDISKIGRNIKEIIIVDNLEKNFKLNQDNGIKIAPYFGEISADDTKLFELQKLLILFYKLKYDDLRMAIKDYKQYIKNKISI